jgi:hypothetical protein
MESSKKCFKCNSVKLLSDFYKHSEMKDGYLNKCKECTKTDANKHRLDNLEKVRAYDRKRSKTTERIALGVEINRIWRAEDKRRQLAHGKVLRAIKKGLLVRQPCIRCGNVKSEGHHEDYDKPLEVMWLCTPCHKQRHKELKMEF